MKRYLKREENKYLYDCLIKKGYSIEQAKLELRLLKENGKEFNKKEREEKKLRKKDKDKYFKEEFAKLKERTNGERTYKRRN